MQRQTSKGTPSPRRWVKKSRKAGPVTAIAPTQILKMHRMVTAILAVRVLGELAIGYLALPQPSHYPVCSLPRGSNTHAIPVLTDKTDSAP